MQRLIILLLLPALLAVYLFVHKKSSSVFPVHTKDNNISNNVVAARLKQHSNELLNYARTKGHNTQYAFLVDMKIPSAENRFFVYDFEKDSAIKSGLVAHGYGKDVGIITFSNVPGSNCSSLGKYKIGHSYHGRFGLAYKLYGLDSTNNNAINRFVVLHSHACVPNYEVAPENICMSQGCPTVSPAFLTHLKTYLDRSAKPVLLYIYY